MRNRYLWNNWATSEELSRIFDLSQRRIQQIIQQLNKENLVRVGVIVIDIGTTNPISKPIYWRRLG